jgi:hypothetical protein
VSAWTRCVKKFTRGASELIRELAKEFAFVHAVLEGFAAIDEYDRHLVVELAPQLRVAIDIDFLPGKAAAARELGEALLHHFAKMAAFARIHYDLSRLRHAWIVPLLRYRFARKKR